ncbi:atherin-like isoform X2 [Camelus ferus]|uniref:Atherin-like isoform X2 n=1 Tax=Camelus ferus TaxID=419612 RepID=A0A8B8TLS0_CAMFR|nr:atherin-like isoform X2 [Camelus ferus]
MLLVSAAGSRGMHASRAGRAERVADGPPPGSAEAAAGGAAAAAGAAGAAGGRGAGGGMEPLQDEAEAVRVSRRRQAAEEAATPVRAPAPLPALCPPQAPPARARGRAGGRGVPGGGKRPRRPDQRPWAMQLRGAEPPGPPGGGTGRAAAAGTAAPVPLGGRTQWSGRSSRQGRLMGRALRPLEAGRTRVTGFGQSMVKMLVQNM